MKDRYHAAKKKTFNSKVDKEIEKQTMEGKFLLPISAKA